MLTGEFRVVIDDKGRIMIPSKLRDDLGDLSLIVTRGTEDCLWAFPPQEWARLSESLLRAASPFQAKAGVLLRRIIAPAQDLELDKTGRVNIPPTLQASAGLQKECVILGLLKYLEIWDAQAYQAWTLRTQDDFRSAAEELGGSVSFFGKE